MADDTQFDPFSSGIMTPQSLQLQRLAMQMQAMKQAQMNGQQNAGQAYGSQALGLNMGDMLGQGLNRMAAGGGGNLLDRIAGQNQQAITGAAQDSQAGAAPAAGAGGAGLPASAAGGASGQDPFASQIMMWRNLSTRLSASGNYQGAQAATDKANALTQARLDMLKTGQDISKSQADEKMAQQRGDALEMNANTDRAKLLAEGQKPVLIPQSDNTNLALPLYSYMGFKDVHGWADDATSKGLTPEAIEASRTAGNPNPKAVATYQTLKPAQVAGNDPQLGAALNDAVANYKYQTPGVTAGVSGSTGTVDAQKQRVVQTTDLKNDGAQMTSDASNAMTWITAAQKIMQGKGKPVVGLFGPVANAISRAWGGVDASNYQQVAKYLGNVALKSSKGTFNRLTNGETNIVMHELNPSTTMTDDAMGSMLTQMSRTAQYEIDSANRIPKYLAVGGDPQSFSQWNQKNYTRQQIVNDLPANHPNQPPGPGQPMRVKSAGDYANLPAGMQYLDPNGVLRTKPNLDPNGVLRTKPR